jgi:hypothetical protein
MRQVTHSRWDLLTGISFQSIIKEFSNTRITPQITASTFGSAARISMDITLE